MTKIDAKHYRTHTLKFYQGKKVVATEDIRNNGGQMIIRGTQCTIRDKYKGFSIVTDKPPHVHISRVDKHKIDLLPNQPFGLPEENL